MYKIKDECNSCLCNCALCYLSFPPQTRYYHSVRLNSQHHNKLKLRVRGKSTETEILGGERGECSEGLSLKPGECLIAKEWMGSPNISYWECQALERQHISHCRKTCELLQTDAHRTHPCTLHIHTRNRAVAFSPLLIPTPHKS